MTSVSPGSGLAVAGAGPVEADVAHDGHEVGAHGDLGAAAPAHDGQHAGEGLGHGVVGIGRPSGSGTRRGPAGADVAPIELTEGRVVALADGGEELGIVRALQLFHLVAHTSPSHRTNRSVREPDVRGTGR